MSFDSLWCLLTFYELWLSLIYGKKILMFHQSLKDILMDVIAPTVSIQSLSCTLADTFLDLLLQVFTG